MLPRANSIEDFTLCGLWIMLYKSKFHHCFSNKKVWDAFISVIIAFQIPSNSFKDICKMKLSKLTNAFLLYFEVVSVIQSIIFVLTIGIVSIIFTRLVFIQLIVKYQRIYYTLATISEHSYLENFWNWIGPGRFVFWRIMYQNCFF